MEDDRKVVPKKQISFKDDTNEDAPPVNDDHETNEEDECAAEIEDHQ